MVSIPLKNWQSNFDELGKNQETLACVGLDLITKKRGVKGLTRDSIQEWMSHLQGNCNIPTDILLYFGNMFVVQMLKSLIER